MYNPIVVSDKKYIETWALLPKVCYKSSKTGLLGVSPFQVKGSQGFRVSCKLKIIGFDEYQTFMRKSPGDFMEDLNVLMQAYKARLLLEKERSLLMSCLKIKTRTGIENNPTSTELYPVLWRTKPVMQGSDCFMALRLKVGTNNCFSDIPVGATKNVGGLFTVNHLPMGFWLFAGKGVHLTGVFEDIGQTLQSLPEVKSTRISSLF